MFTCAVRYALHPRRLLLSPTTTSTPKKPSKTDMEGIKARGATNGPRSSVNRVYNTVMTNDSQRRGAARQLRHAKRTTRIAHRHERHKRLHRRSTPRKARRDAMGNHVPDLEGARRGGKGHLLGGDGGLGGRGEGNVDLGGSESERHREED